MAALSENYPRIPSNFRSEDTIQHFFETSDISGISGIDTRALTKILREKGTMNGMITTDENFDLDVHCTFFFKIFVRALVSIPLIPKYQMFQRNAE